MAPFTTRESSTDLFGSPTGTVGSEDMTEFAKELLKHKSRTIKETQDEKHYEVSDCVILFDEIEKSHKSVRSALLGLLDQGKESLTCYYTKRGAYDPGKNIKVTFSFKRSLFLFTSNLFQEAIVASFQMGMDGGEIGKQFEQWNGAASKGFSSAFVERVKILPFGPIPRGETYQQILAAKEERFFGKLRASQGFKKVKIANQGRTFQALENRLYGNGIGLRKIDQFLDGVEAQLQEAMKTLGKPETKKLTLTSPDGNRLVMQIDAFIQDELTGRVREITLT